MTLRPLAAALAWCLAAAAAAQPTLPPPAATPGTDTRTPLVLTVEGASRVTLLGSIHFLDADAYPLPAVIEEAYTRADVVAFEVDIDDTDAIARAVLERGLFRDGRTLRDVVGKTTYRRLEAVAAGTEMPVEALALIEPWAVELMLRSMVPPSRYRADLGVDRHLFDRAHADGKETVALETAEDQIAVFDAVPEPDQVASLRETLAAWYQPAMDFGALVDAWGRGDEAALDAATAELPAASRRALLHDRNAAWLPHVEALLARDGAEVLVVVGAAHLVGDDSVPAMLRARGWTVTRE